MEIEDILPVSFGKWTLGVKMIMADNEQELSNKDISLLDLVDRILAKGVILKGDITISVADIDLIYLGLKVLLSNVDKAEELREHQWEKMKRGEA